MYYLNLNTAHILCSYSFILSLSYKNWKYSSCASQKCSITSNFQMHSQYSVTNKTTAGLNLNSKNNY